jgi:hypothetical protein
MHQNARLSQYSRRVTQNGMQGAARLGHGALPGPIYHGHNLHLVVLFTGVREAFSRASRTRARKPRFLNEQLGSQILHSSRAAIPLI